MLSQSLTRRFLFVSISLLCTLVLASCGSSSTSSGSNKVIITYLTHWSGAQVTQLNQAISTYEKSNPNVTINVHTVPFGNLLTTITTQGNSANGPTIMGIYNLW